MTILPLLLVVAGLLHLATLVASVSVPFVLDWRTELAKLGTMLRHLFWVYGGYIAATILAFGLLALALPHDLAAGTPLARGVCGFIALFWGARLAIQLWLFDPRPYLTHWVLTCGYHALTAIFLYNTLVFAYAACHW